jgi:hypothetical protein
MLVFSASSMLRISIVYMKSCILEKMLAVTAVQGTTYTVKSSQLFVLLMSKVI